MIKILNKIITRANILFKPKSILIAPLTFKENLFDKTYKKRALVSFIVYPYTVESNIFFHTQTQECICICECLNELEYVVDLIDYNNYDDKYLNKDYNLIFGFGEPIEKIVKKTISKNYLLIAYRNGCDNVYSDKVSLDRVYKFYSKTGRLLANSAIVNPESWRYQIKFADSLIIIGNDFVKSTFKNHSTGHLNCMNLFYLGNKNIKISEKDFSICKKNFLWFGSRGSIHKGLDILLDFFSKRHELNLYVAGLHTSESEFINYYKEVFELKNIRNIGFIDVTSNAFLELMNTCGAIISPSVSEGQSGAVLTVMAAGGLIPIISKNVGLDINDHTICINGFETDNINDAVNRYLEINNNNLMNMAKLNMQFVKENYTFLNYQINLKNNIISAINNYDKTTFN